MRANTNPCSLCEHCDDSCDVCLHQPYENVDSSYFYGPSSCDESEDGNASTDVDSASDEEGSWFTTPWSKLIAQRVAGYEVDPEIGVQLTPLEEQREEEGEGRGSTQGGRGNGQEEDQKRSRRRRVRRRRRRHSTPGPRTDEAAKDEEIESRSEEAVKDDWIEYQGETVKDEGVECRGETVKDEGVESRGEETVKDEGIECRGEETVKDEGVESRGEETVKDEGAQCQEDDMAKDEDEHRKEEVIKDEAEAENALRLKNIHENSWRETVESCAPLVSAS